MEMSPATGASVLTSMLTGLPVLSIKTNNDIVELFNSSGIFFKGWFVITEVSLYWGWSLSASIITLTNLTDLLYACNLENEAGTILLEVPFPLSFKIPSPS